VSFYRGGDEPKRGVCSYTAKAGDRLGSRAQVCLLSLELKLVPNTFRSISDCTAFTLKRKKCGRGEWGWLCFLLIVITDPEDKWG
jgi:hypothetical protein